MSQTTESIRLNQTEIDTILTGCAYNMAQRTLDYNKSRVLSVSLSRKPATQPPPSDPQSEQTSQEAKQARSFSILSNALDTIHKTCQSDIESFPKKLALQVSISSKLLSAKVGPTNAATLTFNAEECEFITEALRTFEVAEVNPVANAELLLAHIYDPQSYSGGVYTESARQTEAEIKTTQSRRDDFICLMAKVIEYGKGRAAGTTKYSNSDQ
jgi:hypothetical protein